MALDSEPAEPFPARNGALVLAPGSRADVFIDAADQPGSTSEILLHDGTEARPVARLVTSTEPPVRPSQLPDAPRLPFSGLPARLDLLNDPDLTKAAGYTRFGPEIVKTYADILSKEDVHPVPPYAKNGDKIWIAWGDTFGKILQGKDDIKPQLDALQTEAERLLK